MSEWLFALAIVAVALVCPVTMWLGRRGIGPGCAICPPRRNEESLEELRARHRALAERINELEAPRAAEPVAHSTD